jgi:DNA repair exonuclease SbcCD ATPase subunit
MSNTNQNQNMNNSNGAIISNKSYLISSKDKKQTKISDKISIGVDTSLNGNNINQNQYNGNFKNVSDNNNNEENKINESSKEEKAGELPVLSSNSVNSNSNSNEIIIALKNELKNKEEELIKASKMNNKIRKNFELLSNELNKYVQKALEDKNKKRKKMDENININEEHKKELALKDKQIDSYFSRIKYLQSDNQKLKNEVEKLKNNNTKLSLNEQLQSKQTEIDNLINENKEIKNELNSYKSADKVITSLKNKNSILRDTIDRLNQRIEDLRKETQ